MQAAPASLFPYLWAGALVAGVALLASPLRDRLDQANIIMLFLLAVLLAAVRLGRGPGILAAFLSVAAFNFFFVHPRLTFAVSDVQYLLTFAVMLAVALITTHLTTGLRRQAEMARHRELRMTALYEMARDLSGALSLEQVDEIVRHFVRRGFQYEACLLLPDAQDGLSRFGPAPAAGIRQEPPLEPARECARSGQARNDSGWHFQPLRSPMRIRGVLALSPPAGSRQLAPEQQQLLETGASLVAIALERVHYIQVAQEIQVQMESERLRNSLLGALSHDLRTPLTALVGLADSLVLAGRLPPEEEELAQSIREEALRTSALVHNLLDMARLQSGPVALRKEWQPLEEVLGAALQARASQLARHRVQVELAPDLPLLELDAVLMERVFSNLLENAAKYTPPGSTVTIRAGRDPREADRVRIEISDNGPGLPRGRGKSLFEKFTRGRDESAIPGVGLGLAIVHSIIAAHQGRIEAGNQAGGGACFSISLPAGTPPALPQEEA
ncbi:DUF4118 domain-containing protein [Azovibrio restrictus]|uniref:DUF4118 domain-containing protein n=1 Tax=Azovibrio restrictus TaxID=146938 RepID=UPI0026EB9E44|nr:DUF4118 domain-containing protein [Azovibrio restrictus]